MEAAAARAEIADLTADKPLTREVVERLVADLPAVGRMSWWRRWRWWARATADLAAALWADLDEAAVAADAYVQSCVDILERAGARAIVSSLAASDPNFRGHDPDPECALCGAMGAVVPADHEVACPWARAREWVAAHGGPDVPEDIEPPSYDDGPDGREPWQGKP